MLAIMYFIFGASMVVALAVVIFHYYARKRKPAVEDPKYRMLEDDLDD
jgi:hypothetical protein